MKITAIFFGRMIQSGLLFAVSIFYMTYAENALFVNYSYYLALGAPLALIILYGGYIEASQVSQHSSSSKEVSLYLCLIVRPISYWLVFTVGCINFLEMLPHFVLLIGIVSFLTSVAMADLYLFREQFPKFLIQILLSSTAFILISLFAVSENSNFFVLSLVIVDKVLLLALCFDQNLLNIQSMRILLSDFFDIFLKPIISNVWFVLSSVLLGVFLGADRIFLVNNFDESQIRQYIVALTMTTPLNFLAAMLGKSTLLDNYLKRELLVSGDKRLLTSNSQVLLFIIVINAIILPVQFYASNFINGYMFNFYEQLMLNVAALLIVVSKPDLADLYLHLRQKVVVYVTLLMLLVFCFLLFFFGSVGVQTSLIRVCVSLLYLMLIAGFAAKTR